MKGNLLTALLSLILAVTVMIIILITTFSVKLEFKAAETLEETTSSEDYIPSEEIINYKEEIKLKPLILDKVETTNLAQIVKLRADAENRRNAAHDMAQAARELGYSEDNPIIILAKEEWNNSNELFNYYDQLFFKDKMAEYPSATIIWQFLKNQNYNDYICAGILGNIMAEVGGHTLYIQYWLGNSSYYGMCQWSKKYYSGVLGANLEEQCNYLINDIKYQFDTFGGCYQNNFNFDAFLQITDEQDAALAFAKCYERCGSASYYKRQQNASVAYNYFVN